MPTSKPRYTVTDTGELESLLDAAQRRWPEITDRKVLLLRLVQEGAAALDDYRVAVDDRRERARAALKRLPPLLDADLLLSDQAWR